MVPPLTKLVMFSILMIDGYGYGKQSSWSTSSEISRGTTWIYTRINDKKMGGVCAGRALPCAVQKWVLGRILVPTKIYFDRDSRESSERQPGSECSESTLWKFWRPKGNSWHLFESILNRSETQRILNYACQTNIHLCAPRNDRSAAHVPTVACLFGLNKKIHQGLVGHPGSIFKPLQIISICM